LAQNAFKLKIAILPIDLSTQKTIFVGKYNEVALKPMSFRCSNRKKINNIKIVGKYWSCFVHCTNPLLLTHKF